MEIDCPRCQSTVIIDNPDEPAFCQACGAALAVEMGGSGFALVSAEDGEEPSGEEAPESEPGAPGALNDPILADHLRWRTGALFAMLFGLTLLGFAAYSGFHDVSNLGKSVITKGKEALWLWGVAGGGLALVLLGGGVFEITRRETRKYLAYLESRTQQDEP